MKTETLILPSHICDVLRLALGIRKEPDAPNGVEAAEQDIINAVCQRYQITERRLRSKSRHMEVVLARFSVYALMVDLTPLSKNRIAHKWRKDHGTILSALKQHQNRMDTDVDYAAWYNGVRDGLKQGLKTP